MNVSNTVTVISPQCCITMHCNQHASTMSPLTDLTVMNTMATEHHQQRPQKLERRVSAVSPHQPFRSIGNGKCIIKIQFYCIVPYILESSTAASFTRKMNFDARKNHLLPLQPVVYFFGNLPGRLQCRDAVRSSLILLYYVLHHCTSRTRVPRCLPCVLDV